MEILVSLARGGGVTPWLKGEWLVLGMDGDLASMNSGGGSCLATVDVGYLIFTVAND